MIKDICIGMAASAAFLLAIPMSDNVLALALNNPNMANIITYGLPEQMDSESKPNFYDDVPLDISQVEAGEPLTY